MKKLAFLLLLVPTIVEAGAPYGPKPPINVTNEMFAVAILAVFVLFGGLAWLAKFRK